MNSVKSLSTLCVAILMQTTLLTTAHGQTEPIDGARLHAAENEPHNWLNFGQGYTNHRFSKLVDINTSNVARLVPKWIYQHGGKGSFQAQPIVADGMMYVTLPGNDVVALAADTGKLIWRYKHKSRLKRTSGGPANRGAAIGYGFVYQATNDGRLIALDRATGKIAWETVVSLPINEDLEGLTPEEQKLLRTNINKLPSKAAPLVYDGMVIIGMTSAGYGIYYNIFRGIRKDVAPPLSTYLGQRGYVAAFDAKTGKELWRWHSTRSKDWAGGMTAKTADGIVLPRDIASEKADLKTYPDTWRVGGTSTWSTPSLDPDLGLIFLGTGNASPNDVPKLRPGDNLYANSIVAVDVRTGQTKWHYQVVPHDLWGYDMSSTSVLFDVTHKGQSLPAVGLAAKTGWFYVLDRRTGAFLFRSDAFVPQKNMFKRPTPEGLIATPGSWGGASWSPVSYDPRSGRVFVPAIHKPTNYSTQVGKGPDGPVEFILTETAENEPSWGTLSAINTRNGGKIDWQIKTDQPLIGGVLATAGNLLFLGEGNGNFNAFDTTTGDKLWQFNAGAGVNAPPVSYAVNGTQYIAVAAGGHGLLRYRSGSALIAFGLAPPSGN